MLKLRNKCSMHPRLMLAFSVVLLDTHGTYEVMAAVLSFDSK